MSHHHLDSMPGKGSSPFISEEGTSVIGGVRPCKLHTPVDRDEAIAFATAAIRLLI